MSEIQGLEAIDSSRRSEAARRIAILDRYIAIPLPDGEDDARHAAEVGVGTQQFLRIARIWRNHRRADLLPGARTTRGGTSQPDRSTRRTAGPAMRRSLVIDEVAVDLRVRLERPRALPVLLCAFDPHDGHIASWLLGEDRLDAAAAAELLLSLPAKGPVLAELVCHTPVPGAFDGLKGIMEDAEVETEIEVVSGTLIGGEARRVLAGAIAGLALRSRPTLRADARQVASDPRVHGVDAARRVVGDAIAEHNAAFDREAPSLPLLPRDLRTRLVRLLGSEVR